jgi:hypothetical protein
MDVEDLAKRIRETCIEAVLQAYEDAGIQGLCAEGRWGSSCRCAEDNRARAAVA